MPIAMETRREAYVYYVNGWLGGLGRSSVEDGGVLTASPDAQTSGVLDAIVCNTHLLIRT